MLPGDYFVEGLAAFFVAHLAYIGAFSVRAGGLRPSASALPFAFAYVLLVGRLAPHVGPLLGPVTAYAAVLLMMAWAALEAWRRTPGPATALALVGAVLFVLSDTLFAFGRFVGTWPYQDAEVMLTYVGAQWCLASSTRPLRRSRP